MKTNNRNYFKKVFTFLILLLSFYSGIFSQTPQYYNMNTGTSLNVFPFSVPAGKEVQWLVLAHDFGQPSQAPPCYITKIYFYMGATGSGTYTDLTIKFGQTDQTALPVGVIYSGPMDTVYFRSSVTLSSTANAWMGIVLDHPFTYDTSLSLVVDVSQCGATVSNVYVRQSTLTGIRRNYINNAGTCIFTYAGQDASMVNCGIDIISLTGVKHPLNEIPASYNLEQNYPNPFNPITKIKYQIPKNSFVSLRIFDLLGNEVAILVNENKKAGYYEVNFDGTNYASGVYFYRIEAESFVNFKKMMLIK